MVVILEGQYSTVLYWYVSIFYISILYLCLPTRVLYLYYEHCTVYAQAAGYYL